MWVVETTAVRYERERPGELVHMDVKKIGRIPDGGGWKAHGYQMGATGAKKRARIGYDYVHSLVDDHSRLAYSEILPDERGPTCAAFLLRAARYFAHHGIPTIERVMTDNASAYRWSLRQIVADLGARQLFHQTPLPLAERQSRTAQPHPPSRVGLPPGIHQQHRPRRRTCALARVLQHSTPTHRTGRPPTHQPTVTNVMAEYI